jgi:nicotinate-nucleotide adenylyltransferase
MSEPILLFGGSFDPFHNGHHFMLQEAISHLHLEKILLIPNYLNPHKSMSQLSAQERLILLQQLLPTLPQNTKKSIQYTIIKYEINHKKPCYTVHTLATIRKQYGERPYLFLMGSDNFFSLHLWKDAQKLINKLIFFVVKRDPRVFQDYQHYCNTMLSGSSELKLILLENKLNPISSSDIWTQHKNGAVSEAMLSKQAENFIKTKQIIL